MQNALWLLALSALCLAPPPPAVAKENGCVKKVAYDALLRLDQRLKMEHKSGLRDTILDGVEMGRTTNLDATRCTNFRAAATPSNMTDPQDEDSDNDGVPDGTEDANQNGRTDMGEFNPAMPGDTTGVIQ